MAISGAEKQNKQTKQCASIEAKEKNVFGKMERLVVSNPGEGLN